MTITRFKDARRVNPFDTFFNDFFQEAGRPLSKSEPAVNIIENGDYFRVEIAAPGMDKGDFKVNVENDVLTISAERKTETEETEEKFTRREFFYNSFTRSFTLPESVDSGKISAKYDNGVLNLHLPKREEAKIQPAREIQIG